MNTNIYQNGIKYDHNKTRWDLLPIEPIEEVVSVLMHGMRKHQKDNWKAVALEDENNIRYYNAALRHIFAWKKGEKIDQDSGKPHLAHAICCLIFQLWKDKYEEKNNTDQTQDSCGI